MRDTVTEYTTETIFTWGAPPLKFGVGAVDELGHECARLDLARVLIVTDAVLARTGVPERVADSLQAVGIESTIFDGAHSEPTDASLRDAVEFAGGTDWDGFLAVGGGSAIDTAKAINLMTTYPGDVMDYVNQPIGEGKSPPGPLKPLIAVPTTAGTGAESTAVCILDLLDLKVKSGISDPRMRPVMAVIDPLLSLTVPPHVTACSGMDVLCHALESYTARPYGAYSRKTPEERATYVGANPISDAFIEKAIPLVARSLRRAVLRGDDLEARSDMMLAASFAGMGFGNAGVHVPHACAYPIAGRVAHYYPADYPGDEPMVPHGESVSVTAPAAFRFTFSAEPDRHVRAAELLDPSVADIEERRERLPTALIRLMQDIGIANGIGALGYGSDDIEALVEGTMKQQRLLTMAPRDINSNDIGTVFAESITNW